MYADFECILEKLTIDNDFNKIKVYYKKEKTDEDTTRKKRIHQPSGFSLSVVQYDGKLVASKVSREQLCRLLP